MHKHRCPKCATVWEHGSECAGVDAAHQCPLPGCKGESFTIFFEHELGPAEFSQSCASDRLRFTVPATSPLKIEPAQFA